MAGITLSDATTALANWLAANAAVAKKQSYSINGRTLTLANVAEIRKEILFWQRQVAALERRAAGNSKHNFAVGEIV